MILEFNNRKLKFEKVELTFINKDIENIFSLKNNKTLLETIHSRRYQNLDLKEFEKYHEVALGKFLENLKSSGNNKYKLFLNNYGDKQYCHFKINDKKIETLKGIYLYYLNNEVMYIGRCLDCFKKRINNGYGKISPKNCYKDGQQTNCHINSLINKNLKDISFFICPLEKDEEIKSLEIELIKYYNPKWNIALKDKVKKL